MKHNFKPKGYNSVSPYFIVRDAERLIHLMKDLFDAKVMRRYDHPDGSIMHLEILLDDSVIMLGEASEKYPPVPMILHVYVPDVDKTFERVSKSGCEIIEAPSQRNGDPDKRATFKDFAGNVWSIGTQIINN